MPTIGFNGVKTAMAKLEKAKKLIPEQIAKTKRRIVNAVLTDLVTNSPQWSGNLARQWYVEHASSPKGQYRQITGYKPPDSWEATDEHYNMGDNPAVAYTLRRERAKIEKIKWNSTVRIVNYAPYAEEVEMNMGPIGRSGQRLAIRSENIHAQYGAVAMVGYASMKYSNLRYLKNLAV